MAFLAPHFDPDVFVSYSHRYPRGMGASPLKKWTHRLIDELTSSIRDFEDENVRQLSLFIDRKIDPTAYLTSESKVVRSARC